MRSVVDFGQCTKCGTADPKVRYIINGIMSRCNCNLCPPRQHFHVECARCAFGWHADMAGKAIVR